MWAFLYNLARHELRFSLESNLFADAHFRMNSGPQDFAAMWRSRDASVDFLVTDWKYSLAHDCW
jgi:hypothetical protein